jgi:Protein of unknown function (DUF4242)
MPRYMIERTFPNGLALSPNLEGKKIAEAVIAANAEHGVTWVHSYVTPTSGRHSVSMTVRRPRRSVGSLSATGCR